MSIKLFSLVILAAMLSCQPKNKVEYTHYSNGIVMRKTVKDEKNSYLSVTEYDSSGGIQSEGRWGGTPRHLIMTMYDHDGRKKKIAEFYKDSVELTLFYENGAIMEYQRFDSLKNILSSVRFEKNGTRDTIPYVYTHLVSGDTIKRDNATILIARIVNVIDSSRVRDGTILITKRFDSLANGKLRIRDTFAMLEPIRDLEYRFKFSMHKVGWDTIYGEIIFENRIADQYELTKTWFYHPVYVRD